MSLVDGLNLSATADSDSKNETGAASNEQEDLVQVVHVLMAVNRVYMPAVIAVGLIGNLLSIGVFLSTSLRRIPSSHYLTALAIADLGMLVVQLVTMLLPGSIGRPVWCPLVLYVNYVLSFVSVWYVVCFTIERHIAVCYPLKRLTWCTVRRARKIICAATVFPCAFNLHFMVLVQSTLTETGDYSCGYQADMLPIGNIFNCVDSLLTLIVPMTVIIALNIGIARKILGPKRRMQRILLTKHENSAHCHGKMEQAISQVAFNRASRHNAGAMKDDRVTKMLLLVSAVFVVMNLPDHIVRTAELMLRVSGEYEHLSERAKLHLTILHMITYLLFFTNFAVNFFLHSLVGGNFRKHVRRMFTTGFKRMPTFRSSFNESQTAANTVETVPMPPTLAMGTSSVVQLNSIPNEKIQ